jgi:hypothetical protein
MKDLVLHHVSTSGSSPGYLQRLVVLLHYLPSLGLQHGAVIWVHHRALHLTPESPLHHNALSQHALLNSSLLFFSSISIDISPSVYTRHGLTTDDTHPWPRPVDFIVKKAFALHVVRPPLLLRYLRHITKNSNSSKHSEKSKHVTIPLSFL